MLLYGTREQIAGRLEELRENGLEVTGELDPAKASQHLDPSAMDFELRWGASDNLHSTLHIPAPPELPVGLSPGQAAQLSEIFEYLHLQSRNAGAIDLAARRPVAREVQPGPMAGPVGPARSQIAEYLRKIGGPEAE